MRCYIPATFQNTIFVLSLFPLSGYAATPVEIDVWHAMAGYGGTALQRLADAFNRSQKAYVVKPIYKGDYTETLTSFAAAFRAKKPPAMVQVFEVGTAMMLAPKGIIKPVGELMQEQGYTLPESDFFPMLRRYYSNESGLFAMPFNVSVPVIFYNADALAKIGYSEANFPKTWDALEVLAAKLKQAGFACAYTSGYPAWILIESFSAIHGLPMVDSVTRQATYNNPAVVNYLTRLLRWQHMGYFEYGGRSDDSTILFTSGRCPLLSQSSGGYQSFSKLVPFRVGVAALPLEKEASSQRFDNVVGGAALWAVAGQTTEVYRGIAQFFAFLAQPSVQLNWHEYTGYLPLGIDGVYETMGQAHPSVLLSLARSELKGHTVRTASMARLGPQNQIRSINDEALEAIFAGMKTPKQAMDDAVIRANYLLLRFVHNIS